MTLSFIALPALFQAPTPLVSRQWQTIFERGKPIAIPSALLSAGSFSYLAYALYKTLHHPRAELYGLAAIATITMIPFTALLIQPTNEKLHEKANEFQQWSLADEAVENNVAKGESSKELIDRWATLNAVRALFPLSGAVIAAWATLK